MDKYIKKPNEIASRQKRVGGVGVWECGGKDEGGGGGGGGQRQKPSRFSHLEGKIRGSEQGKDPAH